jgi:alpha-beta hydrolase superfamily lysophospholipase
MSKSIDLSSGKAERVEFASGGQRVIGVLHLPFPSTTKVERIVITCHGFASNKDSQKYLQISERFSSQGIAVLRFDFRGSGESEGGVDLLSNRIADLKAAIRFVIKRGFNSIGVLGSSLGGTTAILATGDTPKVRALVTWSTPCQFVEPFESVLTPDVKGYRGGTERVREEAESSEFMKDLSKYSVIESLRRINRILIIHCKGDAVVPWTHAKMILEYAQEPKQLKVFEKGDHQLLDPSIRKEAIELSLKWFTKYL